MAILLAAVTYLDRVAMSVLQRPISQEFGLTEVQMGLVFSAFYVAYGAFEIPTGWWADKMGSRRVLTVPSRTSPAPSRAGFHSASAAARRACSGLARISPAA